MTKQYNVNKGGRSSKVDDCAYQMAYDVKHSIDGRDDTDNKEKYETANQFCESVPIEALSHQLRRSQQIRAAG